MRWNTARRSGLRERSILRPRTPMVEDWACPRWAFTCRWPKERQSRPLFVTGPLFAALVKELRPR